MKARARSKGSLDADALTGTFHTRIFDVLSGNSLLDNTQSIVGWTPGQANWDSIAFFGRDLSNTNTVADQAVVDNINISSAGMVPEPSTYSMLMADLGLLGIMARRTKKISI